VTATPTGLETQELSRARAQIAGAAAAFREDRVHRGGQALGAILEDQPVLRGMLNDERIPAEWRERVEAMVRRHDRIIVGRA